MFDRFATSSSRNSSPTLTLSVFTIASRDGSDNFDSPAASRSAKFSRCETVRKTVMLTSHSCLEPKNFSPALSVRTSCAPCVFSQKERFPTGVLQVTRVGPGGETLRLEDADVGLPQVEAAPREGDVRASPSWSSPLTLEAANGLDEVKDDEVFDVEEVGVGGGAAGVQADRAVGYGASGAVGVAGLEVHERLVEAPGDSRAVEPHEGEVRSRRAEEPDRRLASHR
eukprot:766394-Hanusia_phi.AAC.6